MNKKTLFFFLRMFFYLSVTVLIPLHPGVAVSFDHVGILQWFVIIPLTAIIAFLSESLFPLRKKLIVAVIFLIPLSLWAGGFGIGALPPFFAGLISFSLTFLLFHHPRWAKLSLLEPFFLAWVCLRLLALSRSGEEAAGQSVALTQFIIVWTAVVFLLHGVIVYFCLYPKSSRAAWKEGLIFLSVGLAAVVMVQLMPPDFIRNTMIENLLPERMPERFRDGDERGIPRDGSGRREGRRTLPRGDNGNRPGLRGISEYNWQNRSGRGRGGSGQENNQYMVKIVASEREPVYMGDVFRGQLDPVAGFLQSIDEPLNRVVHQRFFVTWFSSEPEFDSGREQLEVFSLSTMPQKFLPWRPLSIDPTILSENSGPLRYIHQVVSNTHAGDPLMLAGVPSRPLSDFEKVMLSSYLDMPLSQDDIELFSGWLNNALSQWQKNREAIIQNNRYLRYIFSNINDGDIEPVNEQLEIILAMLTGFSRYQYNLSYDDIYSIDAIKYFLFDSTEGDCVEFSNSLALLGRLAGIPSRVVTGYLAAEGLQTNAHLRGLRSLRERIPLLQEFPFENLFMVTNLHGHSWTQFYIPGYGWLDIEATAFAIPPVGMGDFNTWDVVIPMIHENRTFSNVRKFPWLAVLRAAGVLACTALVLAYALRYGRELALFLNARHGGRSGARSLYLLLLARLAADGKPIKPASKTATEYLELFPKDLTTEYTEYAEDSFRIFASIYSELRWRTFDDKAEFDERFLLLKKECHNILKTTRQKGIHRWLIRLVSLRGLAYL